MEAGGKGEAGGAREARETLMHSVRGSPGPDAAGPRRGRPR
jgi:hypothetical protein